MKLLLPRKDYQHAVALRWQMITHTDSWRFAPYEQRAELRELFTERVRAVAPVVDQTGHGVHDVDFELVAFAKRHVARLLISSYLISFFTVGFFPAAAVFVAVELIAENFFGTSLNVLYVIAVTWPVMTMLPAVGLAWLRGASRSYRLIRHAARARRDMKYLLPVYRRGGSAERAAEGGGKELLSGGVSKAGDAPASRCCG
ncbi:hypothetical protein [Opitutus terrae]|uniref:Uncharacterized protein n=1 Tax=Opitutus terrae (strain DSM 11246 / JCM 15787 / PB90-1) TaxID=452637 RepID=B2A062_OPITP|nr:hypothetical protein [Opitutus terrae]ACB77398.1 hypothetical protein Oter_4124 [Opitutus terrae PB90-1]